MSKIEIINEKNFEDKITKAALPALVTFSASWCPPCKALYPELEKLAETTSGKLVVYKVDVDESPNLSSKFAIVSIPTVILFQDGKEQRKRVGFADSNMLMDWMKI